jgi:hypothetical protein
MNSISNAHPSISFQVASKMALLACCLVALTTTLHFCNARRNLKNNVKSVNMDDRNIPISTSRSLVKGIGTYRLAVFGSSDAWGAGLENRYDAYPYLVSPEVVNYADFSAGPNYPATCLNTLVGDDTGFDVIILDFWLKGPQGLYELATRLRRRYPNAILLFCKIWSPILARRQPFQGSSDEMSIVEWKESLGIQNATYEITKHAIEADDGYWYFPNYEEADTVFETAMTQVGGIQFEFPKRPTVKQTIIDYMGYFDVRRHHHVSKLGHEAIAQNVKTILSQQYNILLSSGANENEIHPWMAGDSCHLWYTDGGCPYRYSANWELRSWDALHRKYAMHIEDEGWIDVENKFDDVRTLYLSFLSTNENWYPKTMAECQGAGGTFLSVELNPATALDERHVHITKTLPVGKVAPGITRVYLKPKEKAFLPFRLIGVSLTNEMSVPLVYGFGTTYNS